MLAEEDLRDHAIRAELSRIRGGRQAAEAAAAAAVGGEGRCARRLPPFNRTPASPRSRRLRNAAASDSGRPDAATGAGQLAAVRGQAAVDDETTATCSRW